MALQVRSASYGAFEMTTRVPLSPVTNAINESPAELAQRVVSEAKAEATLLPPSSIVVASKDVERGVEDVSLTVVETVTQSDSDLAEIAAHLVEDVV